MHLECPTLREDEKPVEAQACSQSAVPETGEVETSGKPRTGSILSQIPFGEAASGTRAQRWSEYRVRPWYSRSTRFRSSKLEPEAQWCIIFRVTACELEAQHHNLN